MSFEVWAPDATTVELVTGATRRPLVRDALREGWWRAAEPVAVAGQDAPVDYGYILDGEGPYPDPRSRRQPSGVHELSQTFDASSFAWSDGAWTGRPLAGSVVYELHIGTFTPEGTLDAAACRLDHANGLKAALIVDVVDRDLGAGLGEGQRRRPPQSAPPTGDQRHFSCEFLLGHVFPSSLVSMTYTSHCERSEAIPGPTDWCRAEGPGLLRFACNDDLGCQRRETILRKKIAASLRSFAGTR